MKNLPLALILCFVLLTCLTCKRGNTNYLNFYNLEDRLGTWVNTEKEDTLEFIDSNNLIRKYSFFSSTELYNYRINDKKLYIKELSSHIETEHPILKVDNSKVSLGNMYITIEFVDNSGTFEKIK